MAGENDWRKTADTTKMGPEGVKAAGFESSKRPPGNNPGGVLHQRRNFPYSYTNMAIAGLAISGAVMYMYAKKKPEAKPADTHPRK